VACLTVNPTIEALTVGAHVLEINPVRHLGATGSAWYRAVNAQVASVRTGCLATDPSLEAIGSYQQAVKPRPYSPVIASCSGGPAVPTRACSGPGTGV